MITLNKNFFEESSLGRQRTQNSIQVFVTSLSFGPVVDLQAAAQ